MVGLLAFAGAYGARAAEVVRVEPAFTKEACLRGDADRPEPGLQGDVPRSAQESGDAEGGYNCGLALVGHTTLDGTDPDTGETRDTANANMAWSGDCAYVSGAGALFGDPPAASSGDGKGVAVVDVSDPQHPVHVRTLRTPGALNTSETIHAVTTADRAILVVGQYGNAKTADNPMDVYDVSDCATPRLLETFQWPENINNLTITADARFVFATQPLQVADLDPLFDGDDRTGVAYVGDLESAIPSAPLSTSPMADLDDPVQDAAYRQTRSIYLSHEAWPAIDWATGHHVVYLGGQLSQSEVLTIVDIDPWLQVDADGVRGTPIVLAQRSGRGHSVRQAAIGGREYLLNSEESPFGIGYGCINQEANPFAGPSQPFLTDITDERNPQTTVQFGLAINDISNCQAQLDSGVDASVHYHDVDDPTNTTFVMASMWNAGVRVFDVREPTQPAEVAYFNPADVDPGDDVTLDHAWGHVRYVAETGQIWFATAEGGFWVVELEPQVRAALGLPVNEAIVHPDGFPGTSSALLRLPSGLDLS